MNPAVAVFVTLHRLRAGPIDMFPPRIGADPHMPVIVMPATSTVMVAAVECAPGRHTITSPTLAVVSPTA